mgnify:CR=1 FL=1
MAENENLSPQEIAVKKYLDDLSEKDECLRTLYLPSKIKDCFRYITEQARKKAVNNCAMIEDSVVYKWARDYYIEELPKSADKQTVEAVHEKAEAAESEKPKEEKEPKASHQLCFDFMED